MPDYSNAKIYKIQCSTGHYYYGSTTARLLCQRMTVHRRDSQKQSNRNNKLYKHINTIGWNNAKIILVQPVQCISRDELLKVENSYITGARDDDLCLNGKVSYRNPEDRQVVEYITCQCGARCLKNNTKRHLTSTRHREGITPPVAAPAEAPIEQPAQ